MRFLFSSFVVQALAFFVVLLSSFFVVLLSRTRFLEKEKEKEKGEQKSHITKEFDVVIHLVRTNQCIECQQIH